MTRSLVRAVATFGFIGLLPLAPGTWASIVTLAIWSLLPRWGTGTVLGVWLFLLLVGTLCADRAERFYGPDDGRIVIDEVAGSLLAVAGLPPRLGIAIIALVLFRLFDILKPPPVYQLQALPGGLGVMGDDLAAGLLSNLVLRLGLLLLPGLGGIAP